MSYPKLDQPEVLQIIFHPRQETTESHPDVIDYDFTVDEGVVVGARFHITEKENPAIIFFHGNGEVAADYDDIGPLYNKFGLNFLAVDYRGYGRSNGSPTASTMMSDAHLIYDKAKIWLADQGHTGPIFIMGRSLGSACAIDIAATYQQEITGLLIDSGFAQTLPLLMTLGVDVHRLGITEMDGFRNVQKIAGITKPTFMLHGQYDQIIPVPSAEILQANSAAKNKQFQVIPGADHNTLIAKVGEMYFGAIKQFVDKVLQVRPKRRYRDRRRK